MHRNTLALLVALVLGAVGCGHAVPKAVDENAARWRSAGPPDYSFVLTRSSMVGECALSIRVRDRKVASARLVHACGWPLDPKQAPTIDTLFARMRHAYRNNDKVYSGFDPTYGFPKYVSVDPDSGVMDDEWGMSVRAFRKG
jgi:hypothetical protein